MEPPIPPEQHLECILELTGMGLWDWDLQRDLLRWHHDLSDGGHPLMVTRDGHPPRNLEEFLGTVHPEDRNRVHEAFQACAAGVLPCRCEYRVRRGDDWHWVRSHGRLVRGEDGTPQRLHGFHVDVHLRRTAQEDLARNRDELDRRVEDRTTAIRSLQERHEAILRGAPDGIVTIDPTGTIESANPAAARLFGYRDDELVGRPVTMLMPAPYAEEHDSYLERFMRTRDARIIGIGREVVGMRRDRSTFPMHLEVSELRLPTGILFIGIMRDISAAKEAEQQLVDTADQLRRSNEDLDDFAYVASHDLKEPLRGISNYAAFLLEDYGERLDVDGSRMLQRIAQLTQRLEDFIDSLLQYSRVGRTDNAVETVDLQKVVSDVIDSMHTSIEERNAVVTIEPMLPFIACDSVRTAEVFFNLIANALKYNRSERPTVRISWRARDGGTPEFCVADNGIGIAAEHRERVFGMFHRLHGREEFGGGTGIGLPLVQKIVERHGGQLRLESEPGHGSRFYFTLGP